MNAIVKYFGHPSRKKEWEVQIATPIGDRCLICQEVISEGDSGTINVAGQTSHYECEMRLVVGSVGHQNKLCHCFGGDQEDPEGMTIREAAVAAVYLWEKNN